MSYSGSYHTDDPAADAERYYCDTHDDTEYDYIVDLKYLICVRVKARYGVEAQEEARKLVDELMRQLEKDERVTFTEWDSYQDYEREGYFYYDRL